MLLHQKKEEFEQIVQATADNLGLGNFQVEKDYYVSLFLKELQKIDNNAWCPRTEGNHYYQKIP